LVTQDHIQNFKFIAYLLLGCTDSKGYVKFTPKYITVGGEGGVSELFLRSNHLWKVSNLILVVTQDHMQNFESVANLLLGYFWLVGGTEPGEIKGFLSMGLWLWMTKSK
jgi:hypothetical protein